MLQTKPVPQDVTCYQLLNNFQLFFWILRKIAANPWMSFKCLLRYHFFKQLAQLESLVQDISVGLLRNGGRRRSEITRIQPTGPPSTNWLWADNILAQNHMDKKAVYIMCIYIHIYFEEKQWLNSGSLSPWAFIAEGFEYWQKAPANSLDHDLLSLGHSIGDKLDNSCHGRCDRLWYMLFKSK